MFLVLSYLNSEHFQMICYKLLHFGLDLRTCLQSTMTPVCVISEWVVGRGEKKKDKPRKKLQ